jgi:UDP-glucose 4-epimerase
MKKTVIVTGGAGFVGSHLVDRLVELYNQVVVIDKVKPQKNRKNSAVKYIKMDIQNEKVVRLISKYNPAIVYHLAAHLHDRESVSKPAQNAMDNVIGLINVCEGAKNAGAKIIFTSSCAVYGPHDKLPISESDDTHPLTPYGITKLTGEMYLNFYNKTFGMSYIAFRPGNIYGPRQDSSAESGVVGIFASKLINNEVAIINNDGKTTRDYVYVSDVVDALIKASESEYVGVLNLGTGIQTATEDIFKYVKECVGTDVVPQYNTDQKDATKYIALNASCAKEKIDWESCVSIKDGIQKTVEWYKNN